MIKFKELMKGLDGELNLITLIERSDALSKMATIAKNISHIEYGYTHIFFVDGYEPTLQLAIELLLDAMDEKEQNMVIFTERVLHEYDITQLQSKATVAQIMPESKVFLVLEQKNTGYTPTAQPILFSGSRVLDFTLNISVAKIQNIIPIGAITYISSVPIRNKSNDKIMITLAPIPGKLVLDNTDDFIPSNFVTSFSSFIIPGKVIPLEYEYVGDMREEEVIAFDTTLYLLKDPKTFGFSMLMKYLTTQNINIDDLTKCQDVARRYIAQLRDEERVKSKDGKVRIPSDFVETFMCHNIGQNSFLHYADIDKLTTQQLTSLCTFMHLFRTNYLSHPRIGDRIDKFLNYHNLTTKDLDYYETEIEKFLNPKNCPITEPKSEPNTSVCTATAVNRFYVDGHQENNLLITVNTLCGRNNSEVDIDVVDEFIRHNIAKHRNYKIIILVLYTSEDNRKAIKNIVSTCQQQLLDPLLCQRPDVNPLYLDLSSAANYSNSLINVTEGLTVFFNEDKKIMLENPIIHKIKQKPVLEDGDAVEIILLTELGHQVGAISVDTNIILKGRDKNAEQ